MLMNLKFVCVVKLSFSDLPEMGFKFPLSLQSLVTCGGVSKGLRVIEKAA